MKNESSPGLAANEIARAYAELQKAVTAVHAPSGADVMTQSTGRRITKTFVYPSTNFHLQMRSMLNTCTACENCAVPIYVAAEVTQLRRLLVRYTFFIPCLVLSSSPNN
jgi:hypothetical protein